MAYPTCEMYLDVIRHSMNTIYKGSYDMLVPCVGSFVM